MEPTRKIVMIAVGENITLLWAFHGPCWPWGSLASSHSLDIAGLELVDPLSADVSFYCNVFKCSFYCML